MKSAQYGRLPSFQDLSEALLPIEAVGIGHEDTRIRINDTGKISVGIPKELVIADPKERTKDPTKLALLSYAVRIAEDGERHQIEDKNNPGSSVELSAQTVVSFLSAIEERKIALFPPPTPYEQRRLNEVKKSIVDLGIARLSQ